MCAPREWARMTDHKPERNHVSKIEYGGESRMSVAALCEMVDEWIVRGQAALSADAPMGAVDQLCACSLGVLHMLRSSLSEIRERGVTVRAIDMRINIEAGEPEAPAGNGQ